MAGAGIKLGVREIISGTFGTMMENSLPYAVYALGMTAFAVIFDLLSEGVGSASSGIIGVVAGFALLRRVLADEGMPGTRGFGSSFISYFGAALLSGLATALGLVLLIIPGLILLARWSLSSGLVVAEDAKAVDSLQRSWVLTRASQWAIIGTFVFFGLIALLLLAAFGGGLTYFEMLGSQGEQQEQLSLAANIATNLVTNLISGLSFAGVVYLTKRLIAENGQLEGIFS